MRKKYKKKKSWQDKLVIVIVFNALLFFILAILFDGGAFPWGEIRDSSYWIVTGTKEVMISKHWFWFTYWQGLFVWLGVGLIIFVLSIQLLFEKETWKNWKESIKSFFAFLFICLWIFFILKNALHIVQ